MRALFAHDHIFYKDRNGIYYSKGSLNSKLWDRYLKHFNQLDVVGRVKEIDKIEENISISSSENVSFIESPSLSGPILKFKNVSIVKDILSKRIKKVDFVIVRLPSEIGNLAAQIAKELKKPYLVEVVGCAWDSIWNYGNLKGKIYAPMAYIKTKKNIKSSPYLIYVTKEYLQKKYPSNGISIGCSDVEIPENDNSIIEKRLLKIAKLKYRNKIIVGTAGNIGVRYKGQDNVIKAISKLKEQGIEIEYQLVGAGNKEYLESKAVEYNVEENVKFIGCINHKEVFEWLDKIDIYIQPSLVEGLPRALIEAMSRGCPVIGSNVGGIPELIDSKYIYNKNLISELIKLIIKIKNDMSKQAIKNYKKSIEFSNKELDKKRNDFYKNIIKNI